MARIERAGGDELVVAVDELQEVSVWNFVAFQPQRIDDNLKDFVPISGDFSLQYARQAFEFIPQVASQAQQGAFGDFARQHDDQHGKQANVDLVDDGLVGVIRQLALGDVDFLSKILKGGVYVESGFELQQYRRVTIARGRSHLRDPFDGAKFLLHGSHEQTLGVLRGDALMRNGDVDDRDVDVRIRLLGNRDVRDGTAHQDEDEDENEKNSS